MKHWSIRKRGGSLPQLWRRLRETADKNISYRKDPVLGFPGTPPIEESLDAFRMFASEHPNNIGFHTKRKRAELGFEGTQTLEREVVYSVGTLVGARDPQRQVDGYICKGGTEGNDHGLWLGRNKLNQTSLPGKYGIAVITSLLAHYSIEKGFNRLFPNPPDTKEHAFFALSPNAHGELTAPIVEAKIRDLLNNGYRKFLLVLTAGTTNLGSVDQIPEIAKVLHKLQWEFDIATYIHVDAAFGGFVLPFLEPEYPFGFQNKAVDSLSVDVHKMGYAPYCSGVFLCRKGFLRYTTTKAEYLASHDDSTVCGSRSGAIVAACWMSINTLGLAGYTQKLRECMTTREYLRQQLECLLTGNGAQEPVFYPSRMNVLTVRFPARVAKIMKTCTPGCDGRSIQDRFCIPDDNHFPKVFKTDKWEVNKKNQARVFRFVLMPHVTRGKIDLFINALKNGLLAQQTSA